MDDPLTLRDGRELPATYLPLVAIAPAFRGARISAPDGRRLSQVVLSTVLDDARHWGHDLVHAVVLTDNTASRRMLEKAGLTDLGTLDLPPYRRYAGVLPPA